jgi:hypothetical protein
MLKWHGKLMLALLIMMWGISCCGNSSTPPAGRYPSQHNMSDKSRMPGEYIITVSKEGDSVRIKEIFPRSYSIQWIKDLGRRRFLIKIEKDPGPETIKLEGSKSDIVKDIQPNYIKRY